MATGRLRKMSAIAFGLLLALGAGCSASDGTGNSYGYGAAVPGCGNGDCSACSTCFDSCMCNTHGDSTCKAACSGTGGSGSSGNEGWPGAGGSGGKTAGSTGGTSGGGSSTGGSGASGSGSGGSGTGGGTSTGGSGTGGGASTGGSGSGGSASGIDALHQQAMARAKASVGFSYWWGHGRFLSQGPSSSNAGTCSGNCPSCTHGGSYGGDCSGLAAKVWQVPSSNTDLSVDSHPYSTLDFSQDTSQWSTVSRASLQQADAMVYRQNGAGHIFIYDHGDGWGSMYAYECKGCSYGCVADMRTASSAYHAIRRTGY